MPCLPELKSSLRNIFSSKEDIENREKVRAAKAKVNAAETEGNSRMFAKENRRL